MSQYRSGIINSTTALISSGVNLMLGFVPDKFYMRNLTIMETSPPDSATPGEMIWVKPMPNASVNQTIYGALGAPTVNYLTTNGVTPIILGADWQSTQYTITGITQANPGVVTVSSATPTNTMALENGIEFTISSVVGMTQLNTNRYIVGNLSGTSFSLYDLFGNPVNTSSFGAYVSGGIANQISYPPTAPILNPITGQVVTQANPAGNQYDIGFEGLFLGSAMLGANGNVLWWEAIWQTPTGW